MNFSPPMVGRDSKASIYYNPSRQTESPVVIILDLTLPYEIALNIFKHLIPRDLTRSCLVSRQWGEVASSHLLWQAFDLRQLFPFSIYFNEDWKSDFNFNVDVRPFNKRFVISILNASCPFSKGKKRVFQTHTLIEMPEGLALEHFTEDHFFVSFSHPDIFYKYGKTPIAKTHCLLIKNRIIEESLSKVFSEQEKIMTKFPFYKIPGFIAALALNIAKLMNSKRNHFYASLCKASSFALFPEDARWSRIEVNIGRITPPTEITLNSGKRNRGIIAAREFY